MKKYTFFKTFTRNGKKYYLINDSRYSKCLCLEYLTKKQKKEKKFRNVSFKVYKGHKYPGCIYVVEE